MPNMPGMGDSKAPQATSASGVGTVESVDAPQRKIKLNHEPIPAFNWPAMSMEVTAAKSVDLGKAKPGAKVKFTLKKGTDGTYTVESLEAAP
ncbi:copper-binding protein [Methylobacterium sp. 092160098-2]|uniref:copper-binding protein n=1 Tax=Methylobacterium sp. 092160098-2 TaxID=3025129 RepID=UPI002381BE0D|nr:copper-binding protein [Methylobacterium sp. 092160098-2]MDE4915981.1 copper-binding protein [Methylobacterium sp. 092160098-2]